MDNNLKQLYSHLKNTDPKRFVLADGYIFSHIITYIRFELFIQPNKIGLKYPKKNISESEVDFLSKFIERKNSNFIYRSYNTIPKNKYSVWELDISALSFQAISDLILSIEENIL